jgi:hypothetical protein
MRLALSQGTNRIGLSLLLRKKTLFSNLLFRTMDEVYNPSNSEKYIILLQKKIPQ